MKFLVFLFLLFSLAGASVGQTKFRLNDASKFVDVELDVGTCEEGYEGVCGPLRVSFFRKQKHRAFQTVTIPQTNLWDAEPKSNVTRRYDDQSTINFGDFNFDGTDDVAICDGTNGGYYMPSYRIYLYSKSKKRFVYSQGFTRMNEGGLGMFETDTKKKRHFVFTKSGCCWHQTLGFDVYRGRPRNVYEFTEAILIADPATVEITTSKLIRGKWRTWVKHRKVSEYYR